MNQDEVSSLLLTYAAGQDAMTRLLIRAREVFRVIQRFNLVGQADIQRIVEYRDTYLSESRLEDLPHHAIFAGKEFHEATVGGNGVTIESKTYAGNNEYDYHRFTLPFAALSQSDAEIEADLRAALVTYLAEVDAHEAKQETDAKAERRAQFEALREEVGS